MPATPAIHKFAPEVESVLNSIERKIGAEILEEKKRFFAIKLLEQDDKIDKIVTNRFLALPIFTVIMFFVYYVSITTVGSIATGWANDGVFGDGWHLFNIGQASYQDASDQYDKYQQEVDGFIDAAKQKGANVDTLKELREAKDAGADTYTDKLNKEINKFMSNGTISKLKTNVEIKDDEGNVTDNVNVDLSEFKTAVNTDEPDPSSYGIWVPGLITSGLESLGCADWLKSLIVDGIVAGVGAVFGFVPCGEKLPIIALIAGALFNGAAWVATSAYFIGIAAIILYNFYMVYFKFWYC